MKRTRSEVRREYRGESGKKEEKPRGRQQRGGIDTGGGERGSEEGGGEARAHGKKG